MNIVSTALFLTKNIGFIAAGIIGINFLIAFHELGHFLFCKLFNIKTPTFSVGFGSFIYSRKIGDTIFGIGRWPLGGYVEIAGLAEVGQGDQKDAQLAGEQSFADKPFWQKFLVMSGGILFNLAFAYFAFALVFMMGVPKSPIAYPTNATSTIETVVKDSPAQIAGIVPLDTITKINDTVVETANDAIEIINKYAGKAIKITVDRGGKSLVKNVDVMQKEFLGQTRGVIGIAFTMQTLPGYSLLESIKAGFKLANTHIINTLRAFKHMFAKRDASSAGGPIAIIKATVDGAQKGIKVFLLLLALISINLAVFNLIPLPILDGGQILFAAIEAIIRRPMPEQAREAIHVATWIGVMLLVLYMSARDIYRIVEPLIQKFIS